MLQGQNSCSSQPASGRTGFMALSVPRGATAAGGGRGLPALGSAVLAGKQPHTTVNKYIRLCFNVFFYEY